MESRDHSPNPAREPGSPIPDPEATPHERRVPEPDPDAPAPGAQAPPPGAGEAGSQAPAPRDTSSLPKAPPAPEAPSSYGDREPPGGWQQPIAAQTHAWAGRPLSGWWSRVAAQIIDWLILSIPAVAIVVLVVVVAAGSDTGAVATAIIGWLAYLLAALFYAPVLMRREGVHNGQTWGKQALGITVVRDSGQPVDLGFAMIREVLV